MPPPLPMEMARVSAVRMISLLLKLERESGGQVALEPGDLEEGMKTAQAIGDDTLQRRSGGRVSPESFTHGSSAQRVEWLQRGYQSGDPASCDTFSGA